MMVPVFRPNEEMAEEDDLEDVEELAAPDSRKGKVLFVALTSDRGLCGGVNSAVTRRLRRDADVLQAQNREFEIVSIGDKGRPQLQRVFPESFSLVIDEAWKNPLNFATVRACEMALLPDRAAPFLTLHPRTFRPTSDLRAHRVPLRQGLRRDANRVQRVQVGYRLRHRLPVHPQVRLLRRHECAAVAACLPAVCRGPPSPCDPAQRRTTTWLTARSLP